MLNVTARSTRVGEFRTRAEIPNISTHWHDSEIELLFSVCETKFKCRLLSASDPRRTSCWGEGLLGSGVMIPQGLACCGSPLGDRTRRIWLRRSFSLAFFPSSDDVLTSSSKRRRRFKNRIGTGSTVSEKCGVNADVLEVELHDIFMAVLTVNNINMFTIGSLAPSPLFFHHYSPAFFFFSHTCTAVGRKK